MIARTWHGITQADQADAYLEVLNRTGVPDYEGTPGNLGVYVLRRVESDQAHFLLISLWEDQAAIERFAGPDIESAVYYDEDREYLLEFEPKVTHYEVLIAPGK